MIAIPSPAPDARIYRCGSLTYSLRQLAKLFFWLLWGDVCYVLMESVVPSVMPFKLKALGASDSFMGVVMVTIPMLIGAVFNPIISFRSDRYRSRWGRRIPFILLSLPFLMVCLVCLGYGDVLGRWLRDGTGGLGQRFPLPVVVLGWFGLVLVFFSFFNTFVNSTFWYLFNDVVPEHLLARFMSWFRMVSMGSASLYSFFVFPYAVSHARGILLGASVVYFVGFGLMCLYVKEGTYPPPSPNTDGSTGLVSAIKTFARECHGDPLYWYLFLGSLLLTCSNAVMVFMLFFFQSTGLNLTQIGQLGGAVSIATATLILGSGWLADRFHPVRVVLAGQFLQVCIVLPATGIWIFWHPAPTVAFWGWMILSVALSAPAAALIGVSDPPLLMRLFPRQNYGQFCSANAMWRAVGGVIGGIGAGFFLDTVRRYAGSAHAYTYIPLWQIACNVPVTVLLYKMYRRWQYLGGDANYQSPLPQVGEVLRAHVFGSPALFGAAGIQCDTASIAEVVQNGTQSASDSVEPLSSPRG